MLDVCYKVQNGMDVLGRATTQGDCLYLGLEDSERRLKDREHKLGVDNLTPPYVDVDAPYLGMGLEDSLQQWIDNVANPRLIVIDTLARVKQEMGKRSGTAYDHDNETLRDIQKLAVKNGVTIVLVSHLNKAPQDYAFDKITGSTGLQGMCDAMWLCERGENGAQSTLIGRGRDIHDFEYSLTWNEETWRYEFNGNLGEVTLKENRKEIVDAMKQITAQGGDLIRPRDVIKHCGYPTNSKEASGISKTMQRMKNNYELIAGFKYGTYLLPEDVKVDEEQYKDSFRTNDKKKFSCL
jgi:RecA-family ATPase